MKIYDCIETDYRNTEAKHKIDEQVNVSRKEDVWISHWHGYDKDFSCYDS